MIAVGAVGIKILHCVIILCVLVHVLGAPQPKQRKKFEETQVSPDGINVIESNEILDKVDFDETIKEISPKKGKAKKVNKSISCPPCPVSSSLLKHSIRKYWENDLNTAYACACQNLNTNTGDGLSQAILYSIHQSKLIPTSSKTEPPSKDPPTKKWEILGPINVGKLEVDSDSTFYSDESFHRSGDLGQFLLSVKPQTSVFSDLVEGGKIHWKSVSTTPNGEIPVQFNNVQWRNLAQGLSSAAVYEFQAWARSTTYARSHGMYVVSCIGPHTVYLRNDNFTHLLIGDVYRGGAVLSTVELRPGPVGLLVPLRGTGQTLFSCELTQVEPHGKITPGRQEQTVLVSPPKFLPDLLEGSGKNAGKGYLLSRVFSVTVQNLLNHGVTLKYQLEKPVGQTGDFWVREAKNPLTGIRYPLEFHKPYQKPTSGVNAEPIFNIAPGQLVPLALEIVSPDSESGSDAQPTWIACRKNRIFTLTITPSQGTSVKVPLEFRCRSGNQSILLSFLDHDDSVTNAAVLFPPKSFSSGRGESIFLEEDEEESHEENQNPKLSSYPFFLTLHGSGITAESHADAYKTMMEGEKEYSFGVDGFILISPTRFGAHNWEGVGHSSALYSTIAVTHLLKQSKVPVPQARPLWEQPGMAAGHSMGGHGAWVLGVNNPGLFSCLSPGAGWVRKEQYADSNLFFGLDPGDSFTDPRVKFLLELGLSETHVDRMVGGLRDSPVLRGVRVRVGTEDLTTLPWFSRRMVRLLEDNSGGNNGLKGKSVLEEVKGMQHWWWDTRTANDGGAVNDAPMRDFYSSCLQESQTYRDLKSEYVRFTKGRNHSDVGSWFLERKKEFKKSGIKVDKDDVDSSIHDVKTFQYNTCGDFIGFNVINPATHTGLCGVKVSQQFRMFSSAQVQVTCSHFFNGTLQRHCELKTGNVKRLDLKFGFSSIFFGASTFTVKGNIFDIRSIETANGINLINPISENENHIEICFETVNSKPHLCKPKPSLTVKNMKPSITQLLEPIREKTLVNYGPLRLVYSRPFHIVFGTPPDQGLRLAMRELAVYLANAHFAAHGTRVRVLSDLDYKAQGFASKEGRDLENIMFIGGTETNKLLKMICLDASGERSNDQVELQFPLIGLLPGDIVFISRSAASAMSDDAEKPKINYGFKLNQYEYGESEHGLITTMPFYRNIKISAKPMKNEKPNKNSTEEEIKPEIAMGVVIHANSIEGYSHLSRLAWPVIPPMVRSPFSNYIPDYMVVGRKIWPYGFGGVLAAGFWDVQWKSDAALEYYYDLS